jgi:hypothetical protein
MIKFYLTAIAVVCTLMAVSQPLTVAEESNFESTSKEADVNEFIRQISKKSSFIKVETLAVSTEGRNIPLMIIADPMVKTPEKLTTDPRMVLYIQANIHAGEVEGKEASLMFARELLSGTKKEVLKNIIFLICPNFNPDGNEAISTKNRTHQNGPKNGVGQRFNGQMLDINRDAIKLETPEMSGLLKNVLQKWDPQVTVDCHTTNGSYHEEPVTFSWMMSAAGDRSLTSYMEKQMMPSVSNILKDQYKVENCFYGEFLDMKNPEKGWEEYASEPRYLTNYIGVRNRLAILNENYVYADYKSRVEGCYGLLQSIADYCTLHSKEIKQLISESDRKTVERGIHPLPADSFPIEYIGKPIHEKVTIKTYEVDAVKDADGNEHYIKTDRKKTVQVPYIATYVATKSVKFPFAYLVTLADPMAINLLKKHGIEVGRLKETETIEVESFQITDLKPEKQLNQGHYLHTATGEWKSTKTEFKAGTYIIRTAQPLANLVAYLLEPQTNDGLLTWNFLDRYLLPQWGKGYNPYPVYKVMNPVKIEDSKLPGL